MEISPWNQIEEPQTLQKDYIQIYKFDKRDIINLDTLVAKCNIISEDEIIRAKKYKYDRDRHTYIFSRSLVRTLLFTTLNVHPKNISISFNDFGKPFLSKHSYIHFNISHSKNIILIGLGCAPLGVDVEYHNSSIDFLELAKSVFSNHEIDQLKEWKGKNLENGFYNIWTKKESYIKAIGKGLSAPLADFSTRAFDIGYNNLLNVDWDSGEIDKWQIFNIDCDEKYSAAVCCEQHIERVKLIDATRWFEMS